MTAATTAFSRPRDVRLSRGAWLVVFLLGAAAVYLVLQGQSTLQYDSESPLFQSLNDGRAWVDANRTAVFFTLVLDPIRVGTTTLVDIATRTLNATSWIGVTAIAGALGLVFVSWRTGLLVAGAFIAIGCLGLWTATMQTLGQMIVAVALSLAIGIPLGIVAGKSDRFQRIVTPVLDLMQIMPTFAYLAPLALLFLIGNATATIATLIYSIPPAIRITSLGIRGVPKETVEAATSLGSTRPQLLRKVELPMSRTTVGLAVNQTIMMALSMVVITAFVGAPGLGVKIIKPLESLDAGASFDAGVAIVLLAMVLDRLTASASQTTDRRVRGESAVPRRIVVAGALAVAAIAVIVGVTQPIGREFPTALSFSFADPVNALVDWIERTLPFITGSFKDVFSAQVLDPIQTVLTTAPWWLVAVVAVAAALAITGRRAAMAVAVAMLAIAGLQVWEPAMETLTQVVVAVAITLAIGVTMGVAAARSELVSRILRPINDAAQTMPAFVYLLPAVALFQATRFTAILAAVIYAIPAVIRLVEDGVRGVSPTAIEAAVSAGATRLQVITKVQLPLARRSLLAATNQGVVLVLAMVVVGGLVGAGALGYLVVAGFSQRADFGSGMAAAFAIVLLGVVLDRITQGAGAVRTRRPGI